MASTSDMTLAQVEERVLNVCKAFDKITAEQVLFLSPLFFEKRPIVLILYFISAHQ